MCCLLWNLTQLCTETFFRKKKRFTGFVFLHADAKVSAPSKDTLLERQKQYRTAALRAKQAGDLEQAKTHMKSSKVRGASVSVFTCLSLSISLSDCFSILCLSFCNCLPVFFLSTCLSEPVCLSASFFILIQSSFSATHYPHPVCLSVLTSLNRSLSFFGWSPCLSV